MSSQRKWNVFLPNGRKLELKMLPKHTGKDLVDIVASHLNLKEKEYFGIMYDVDGLYNGWLNEEKAIVDHDIAKKSRIDFYFSVKLFVESVTLLNHAVTAELYFLHIRSLIYKGYLETDNANKVFTLAAYVLQVTCGDYESEGQAISQLKTLPVLPKKITRSIKLDECERAIISSYKKLQGRSKGEAVVDYLSIVESIPAYGLHYFKVKDKSGVPWFLGISYKGISQFDVHNKIKPTKTFHWRQLENIFYKEKKFTIEVNENNVTSSSRHNNHNYKQSSDKRKHADTRQDSNNNNSNQQVSAEKILRLYAWYGSNNLIKNLFSMSITQHRFYLDRKQSKGKLHNDSSRLNKAITSNTKSLIEGVKQLKSTHSTPTMTRKKIKDVDVTVKKASKEETPELRQTEREMIAALKSRRTELEDRLYDKVQELKKLCLQETEFTGKLPEEYIRYLDLNEKVPKVKKRFGAEYKVKLKDSKATGEQQTTVTAASSYSSGFGSDVNDGNSPSVELAQCETEAALLEQICAASYKLARESKSKRTRDNRYKIHKSNLEKLKKVEDRMSELRAQVGNKEPTERASMLFPDDFDYTSYDADSDDNKLLNSKYQNGSTTMSSSGSLSPDAQEDGVSLSSGGDALSTRSTPALHSNKSNRSSGTGAQQRPKQHPASTAMERRRLGSNVSSKEGTLKRSLTPPPSFRRSLTSGSTGTLGKFIPPALASSSSILQQQQQQNSSSTLQRSPIRASHDLLDHSKVSSASSGSIPPPPNAKRNWTARKWERPKTQRGWAESALDHTSSSTCSSDRNDQQHQQAEVINRDVTQQHDNHEKQQQSATTTDAEDAMSLLSIATSGSGASSAVIKRSSTPNTIRSRPDVAWVNPTTVAETIAPESVISFRKRSSSFDGGIETVAARPQQLSLGVAAAPSVANHPPSPQMEIYNVPLASPKLAAPHQGTTARKRMLQPPPLKFDTNINICMQYGSMNQQQQPAYNRQQPVRVSYPHHQRPIYPMQPPPPPNKVTYQQVYPVQYPPTNFQQPPSHHSNDSVFTGDYEGVVKYERDDSDLESNVDYWCPAFHEYSNRASLADNCNRKQEILRTIEDHIKRSSTATQELQRKVRERFRAEENSTGQQQHRQVEETWAGYQQKLLSNTATNAPTPREPMLKSQQQQQAGRYHHRTNIFQHNKPPVSSISPSVVEVDGRSPPPSPMLYRTQRHIRSNHNKTAYYPINLIAQPTYHHHHQQQQRPSYDMVFTNHQDGVNHMKPPPAPSSQVARTNQRNRCFTNNNIVEQSYQQSTNNNNPQTNNNNTATGYFIQHTSAASGGVGGPVMVATPQVQRASPVSSNGGMLDDNSSVVSARSNPLDRVVARSGGNNNYMTANSPYMTRRSVQPQQQSVEHLHYPIHNYSKPTTTNNNQYQQDPPPYQGSDYNTVGRRPQQPYYRRHAASADDLLRRANDDQAESTGHAGTLV